MTPAVRIARLRDWDHPDESALVADVLALCDDYETLAARLLTIEGTTYYCARCTLTDEETEAARHWVDHGFNCAAVRAILRRLLEP